MERGNSRYGLGIVILFAAAIYVATLIAPPHLMDDVDAVQAQIGRNMLDSGDWVTARLDGVAYLEKSPLKYWMIASSFAAFGVSDTAARLPVVLSVLAIAWLIGAMGRWAFGERAGFYSGLVFATSLGVFLFTRILIPDIILTGTIALALWGMLRALDEAEARPRLWIYIAWTAMGVGLLLKGLIAALFPVGAAGLYLLFSRQFFTKRTWQRLRPFSGVALMLLIAAPWHILATLRNPPYFDFSMDSGPGKYRGFFWFYFFNEHILRFLNRRWPRDYNTVPRTLFWLLHLLWFFPWSVYLARTLKLNYRGEDRAARLRLLCLCLAGFVLVFFTFSTTQEYYSMPAYPAFALLLGCVMAEESSWIRWSNRVLGVLCALALAAILVILVLVWQMPAPGDISQALAQHPEMYTLSMGHTGDLTLASFAYLKLPLAMAGLAFALGVFAAFRKRLHMSYLVLALMMVLFLNAARIAMIAFDPYLSSEPLAAALNAAPKGRVVMDDQYYTFSSIFFYSNVKSARIVNGRVNNLEYGSYAPGAPDIWLTDAQMPAYWNSPERTYLFAEKPAVERYEKLLGRENLHVVKESGGKFLFVNQP
jgi:4-amino-4-deoxy-L-arabinose transferase-like glycosyltransferase